MRDFGFAQFPAEQDNLTVYAAGEIEQAYVDVFDLHAGGVNFGDGIFRSLNGALALGLATRHGDHIDQSPAIEKDALREFLKFRINFFDQFLAVDRVAQQRFQGGEQHLGILQGESSSGHFSDFTSKGLERWKGNGLLGIAGGW